MAQGKKGSLKGSIKREFSAGGVVFKKGKNKPLWLVGKHSGYKKWVLPKGLIEEGERGIDTAVREVEEEMGVRAHPVKDKPVHKVSYFYRNNKALIGKQVSFYLMEYENGDPTNHGWEMEDARWLTYNEARDKLAFEGEKEALEKAKDIVD